MTQTVKTLLFLAAAIVVVVVAFLVRPAAPTGDASDLNEAFFPDFTDPLKAVSLEVVKFDSALAAKKPFKVAQQDGVWVIPSHENYPADAATQMKEAASLLIGLKRLGAVSGDKTEHEKFGVIDPNEVSVGSQGVGTLVRLSDKDGRDLARLIIGLAVNDQPGQHYVRLPGADRVYVAAIDDKNLTTNFADWIERDLLGLDQFEITRIKVDNYSIDETEGVRRQGDTLDLTIDGSGDKAWSLKGLKEEEELNKKKLDDLRAAIDNLNIVGVERKPEMLVTNLRAGREMFKEMDNPANRVIFSTLRNKGFYAMPVEVLNKQDWMIYSNEGEVIVGLQNGVEYVLRFGEITEDDEASEGTKEKKDEKSAEKSDKKDGKDGDAKIAPPKPKKTGSNRYMYAVARLNEGLIKKPELLVVPEWKEPAKPEAPKPDAPNPDAPKPDSPKPDAPKPPAPTPTDEKKPGCDETADVKADEKKTEPPAEKKVDETKADEKKTDEKKTDEKKPDPTATIPPTVPPTTPAPTTPPAPAPPTPPTVEQQKAAHEAMVTAINAENARRQKEYDVKIEEAKKKVAQLNARFAPWYYIISDAEFQKMRVTRKDIVQPNKALINKRTGEAFLAANKTKEGVITTASGLQYKVIKEGTGKTPKATDRVAVAYKGQLIDGTVFDESKPGMPAEFGVDGVIAGWTEALQLMKEGGKLQLFIPSELAYKEKGQGDTIGPNQTLIFDVELIQVKVGSPGTELEFAL